MNMRRVLYTAASLVIAFVAVGPSTPGQAFVLAHKGASEFKADNVLLLLENRRNLIGDVSDTAFGERRANPTCPSCLSCGSSATAHGSCEPTWTN